MPFDPPDPGLPALLVAPLPLGAPAYTTRVRSFSQLQPGVVAIKISTTKIDPKPHFTECRIP
jgi:hypothetical protein